MITEAVENDCIFHFIILTFLFGRVLLCPAEFEIDFKLTSRRARGITQNCMTMQY